MKAKINILLVALFAIMPIYVKAAVHSAGTNVISSGTVFMITDDGQRRPYTSAGAFLSYGFNSWNGIEIATAEDLALPEGAFIPPRDGKIICSDRGADKGTCYLITNGKRAGFTSEKVFKALGFDFSKALYGDISFLENDSNIADETESHRVGVLINKNGTIYLIGSDGLLGIPSEQILKSWGYTFGDTIWANSKDQNVEQKAVISDRIMGELRPKINLEKPISQNQNQNDNIKITNSQENNQQVDICLNIEGGQTTIPTGMTRTNDGNCAVITTQQTPPLAQNTQQPVPQATPTPTPQPSPTSTPIGSGNQTATTTPVSTSTPVITPTPPPTPQPVIYSEKYRLIRDGQIVGYKRAGGPLSYSYDNRVWFQPSFPYNSEQKFIKFDSNSLSEIYQGDIQGAIPKNCSYPNTGVIVPLDCIYTEKYRIFDKNGYLVGYKKVNNDAVPTVVYSYEDKDYWSSGFITNYFTYPSSYQEKKFLRWDVNNLVQVYEE